MESIEPKSSDTPLDQIPEQPFSLPQGCILDTDAHIPTKCIARYHGFGQRAGFGLPRPTIIPVHVVVFNDDLLGVIWIDFEDFTLYSRVKETFTTNNMQMGPSCL
ncbi:F-box only protein 31 [Chionoecetes opilio]|uniref:F-box only protein 31 n=1 Tax=Chionoecetes opilio TaxID=41210 RepID=A0A8J4YC04_CHIOP|nr:F-box only protein 31 [Chionoecetes opilio]